MPIKSPGTGKKFRECDLVEIDMARSMKKDAEEFAAQQKERSPENARAAQQQTSIRQFLLFLIFFIIASAILCRNSLASWLLSLDETLNPQKSSLGQSVRTLSEGKQKQNQLLKDIGYDHND